MTAPIQEPSTDRALQGFAYARDQLFRRPAPPGPGRFVGIVFPSTEVVEVGNDAGGWFLVVPSDLNGALLTEVAAGVYTAGTSLTIQVRNVTQAVDMLSTAITIDSGERTSYTAATPPVINVANADVNQGDAIVVDVDVAGGAIGLDIILAFS